MKIESKYTIKEYADILNNGGGLAEKLFTPTNDYITNDYEETAMNDKTIFEIKLEKAKKMLAEWTEASHMPQRYTTSELARELLMKEISLDFIKHNEAELFRLEGVHLAALKYAMSISGLIQKMIEEGNEGRKIGVIETSARLSPLMTFNDASKAYCGTIIPYSIEIRKKLIGIEGKSIVSENNVLNDARMARRLFNSHYIIAETSAAPRTEIPKSGKAPETYICGIIGNETPISNHKTIKTPFRQEFDARVREIMYDTLLKLYRLR